MDDDIKSNVCDKCSKAFKYYCLLVRHQNSKTKCDNDNKIIKKYKYELNILNNTYNDLYDKTNISDKQCYFCLKMYLNKSNLKRHLINNCVKHQEMIKNKEELTNKIKLIEEKERHKIEIENNKNKENKELKKELKKIKEKLKKN